MLCVCVWVCSIDDIEDNSKLRRGIPVAHSIYGVAHTINSANYVYFLALEKTSAMGHPRGVAIFTSGFMCEYMYAYVSYWLLVSCIYNNTIIIVCVLIFSCTICFTEQLLELHRGQGKDIYWRDSYICPTEEEYMEMVRQSMWHS